MSTTDLGGIAEPTADQIAHLKSGDEVTACFGGEDWESAAHPITGVLWWEPSKSELWLGAIRVRDSDGAPNPLLRRLISPLPPEPTTLDWPVGTRLTDGDQVAIKTDMLGPENWLIYRGCSLNESAWRSDVDVVGWKPVEKVAVDADALAVAIWNGDCPLIGIGLDDLKSAIREHLPAAIRPALPEGRVAVDLRDMTRELLELWTTADANSEATPIAIMKRVSQAELARRNAEGGERQ